MSSRIKFGRRGEREREREREERKKRKRERKGRKEERKGGREEGREKERRKALVKGLNRIPVYLISHIKRDSEVCVSLLMGVFHAVWSYLLSSLYSAIFCLCLLPHVGRMCHYIKNGEGVFPLCQGNFP